ncbi:hypothetical protein [Micromonospora sp. NPDC049799]|uniref:hypothetical protein n=1 Tax=Micromonospora sp. NPDC049799 TaxID=3154741 RepID=UPI00340C235B
MRTPRGAAVTGFNAGGRERDRDEGECSPSQPEQTVADRCRGGVGADSDLGSSPQDPTPHMVASAAVAALHRSAMTGDQFHWNTEHPELTIAHFDRALRFIQHGLDGLRRDDHPSA